MKPRSLSCLALAVASAVCQSTGASVDDSSPAVSATIPTPSLDPTEASNLAIMRQRRVDVIMSFVQSPQNLASPSGIPQWLQSLGSDGKWPDSEVNYTSGCDAQRANWPAYTHWDRILGLAAAWKGGLPGFEQYTQNSSVQNAISSAMDWWFERDFTNDACLDGGGTSACPCGTSGLWNTNWYSNVIFVPMYASPTCILMNDTLSDSQFSNCNRMTRRSISPFYRANVPGFVSGANILDMSKIGIDNALLVANMSLIAESYGRIHAQLAVQPGLKVDGIKPDGTFGQHGGLLYNGNYGKDFSNDVIQMEIVAGGTPYEASSSNQAAFATLIDADRWMMFRNTFTNVLHWDFSVLPRFISFPVIDGQATAQINLNLSQIGQLGTEWDSPTLIDANATLSKNTSTANAGDLVGNRMFPNNDYMVHRGANYVSTLKMFSTRTLNTECTNSQNPLGFHLADGTLYTYVHGDEYEDIAAAWDWNLIPGITTDYGNTPLNCNNATVTGLQAFVGGASTGSLGTAAMRYTNPMTKSLSWQKAWFFLADGTQHVMVSNLTSNSQAPVYSVLDQKKQSTIMLVNGSPTDGSNVTSPRSLWHDNVGYTFSDDSGAFELSTKTGAESGSWQTIGTSTQPPETVNLFSAAIQHVNLSVPLAYTIYPAMDWGTFVTASLSNQVQTIQNDAHISAVHDQLAAVAMAVFWDVSGGTIHLQPPSPFSAPITLSSNSNAAVIYEMHSGNVTVSDPSQLLGTVQVTVSVGEGNAPHGMTSGQSRQLIFDLPSGGMAGNSVSQLL